jgi:hypothetical protein
MFHFIKKELNITISFHSFRLPVELIFKLLVLLTIA